MNNRLIAFTGLAQSGKTTAAHQLVLRGWARISFADPLRRMLRALGVTDEQMSTGKNEPIQWLGGKTPRQLLQTLGTEWGRQMVDENIWTNVTKHRIEGELQLEGVAGVVFDDCRFPNEAWLIRELGGAVIKLEREGTVQMNHASEQGVPPELVDAVITNNTRSPNDLYCRLVELRVLLADVNYVSSYL